MEAPPISHAFREIGEDVFLGRNVEIRRPHLVSMGSHVAIDSGFYCTTELVVGDYVHIGPYVTVIGGERTSLILDGFNTIGAGTRILCASDAFGGDGIPGNLPEPWRDTVNYAPVRLHRLANVGTNVVIHPGVTLGEGSVVGSCSLVLEDTEPWTIYHGVPARPQRVRPSSSMLQAVRKMGYDPKS